MDYDIKANLTTILSTYLIPILIGYGFSSETSNALVGVIVAVIIIGFNMWNKTSKIHQMRIVLMMIMRRLHRWIRNHMIH